MVLSDKLILWFNQAFHCFQFFLILKYIYHNLFSTTYSLKIKWSEKDVASTNLVSISNLVSIFFFFLFLFWKKMLWLHRRDVIKTSKHQFYMRLFSYVFLVYMNHTNLQETDIVFFQNHFIVWCGHIIKTCQ